MEGHREENGWGLMNRYLCGGERCSLGSGPIKKNRKQQHSRTHIADAVRQVGGGRFRCPASEYSVHFPHVDSTLSFFLLSFKNTKTTRRSRISPLHPEVTVPTGGAPIGRRKQSRPIGGCLDSRPHVASRGNSSCAHTPLSPWKRSSAAAFVELQKHTASLFMILYKKVNLDWLYHLFPYASLWWTVYLWCYNLFFCIYSLWL